jgi:hypothetical protein
VKLAAVPRPRALLAKAWHMMSVAMNRLFAGTRPSPTSQTFPPSHSLSTKLS